MTTKTIGQQQAHQRQLLRRSNATVPIPHGQYKKSRSMTKQAIRQEYAR